ncbi:MAG TPA: ACT domain-containing protein [Thermoanaerobaculia bacterium]|jgi:hypothetical protein
MNGSGFELVWLSGRYRIGRFPPSSALVSVPSGPFVSITRTADELSLVCPEEEMPRGGRSEGPYALFRVAGRMDLGLTGVIAALTAPLAAAAIPVFTVATFDTDYVLVRESDRERAQAALEKAGHRFAVAP